jgi:hypothetical protein
MTNRTQRALGHTRAELADHLRIDHGLDIDPATALSHGTLSAAHNDEHGGVARRILEEISESLAIPSPARRTASSTTPEFDRALHVALGIAQSIALALGDGEWPAGLEYGNAEELEELGRSLEAIEARMFGRGA